VAIWCILWLFRVFFGHLVYFFPVLECCTQKNLATLLQNAAAPNFPLNYEKGFDPFSIVCRSLLDIKVARWHIFKPKIPIWVNSAGP
jgi:hypothetical protein